MSRLTHGMTRSPTHQIWVGMRKRCTNPKCHSYKYYGGRGITFSIEWNSFENFLADMGERPPGYSLDRIDPDGNYCAENCRWIPLAQQRLNRRQSVYTKSLRTHCANGHEFTNSNTRHNKYGHRICRVCHNLAETKRRAKIKAFQLFRDGYAGFYE